MNEGNLKKIYLCCQKNKKPYYKQKINQIKLSPVLIVDHLDDADMILCIDNHNKDLDMQEDLLQAKEYGIDVHYINQYLISDGLMEDLLNNTLAEDKENFSDYDYSQDYEY